jgi:glucose/arabinose dehydrogenase
LERCADPPARPRGARSPASSHQPAPLPTLTPTAAPSRARAARASLTLVLFAGALDSGALAQSTSVPLATELVVGGLANPVWLATPPGDSSRLYVLEQTTGRVQIVEGGEVAVLPFLDVSADLTVSGEEGLLSLAFHPNYALNRRVFVYWNDATSDAVLKEFEALPDGTGVIPGSEVELLRIPKPFPQHNGSMLTFGPDGMLYLSVGDGGGAGDPFQNSQDLSTLLGTVLRLDVDQQGPGGEPYAIPANNPFVGVPGARGEIWHYGLRNPWRGSFDALTGSLWIGDVGQGTREEVNYVAPGASGVNFGWPCAEGMLATGQCSEPPPALSMPFYDYDHNDGCAVLGGYVYRGSEIPSLEGTYLFGDYCTSRVWSLKYDGQQITEFDDRTTELLGGLTFDLLSSFAEDSDGELYILRYFNGEVLKVVGAPELADCDGNGIPDPDQIAEGSSFDVNNNGLLDSCEVLLEIGDVQIGQTTTFRFLGADPGGFLVYLYTPRGIGPGPCLTPDLCLDLIPFQVGGVATIEVLTFAFAGGQGAHLFSVTVPPITEVQLAFQVLTVGLDGVTLKKSNAVQRKVQLP